MISRRRKLFVLLLCVITMSGCQVQDIGKRAYVTMMSIDVPDKPKSNEETGISPRYKVTAEIVKLPKYRTFTDKPANIIISAEGEDIDQALQYMQTRLSFQINLLHLRGVLIGEEMAKKNLKDIFSFIEKDPDIARRLRLAFVQGGRASDLFQVQPRFTKIVNQELISMTQINNPLARSVTFGDLIRDLRSNEGRAFGTRFLFDRDEKLAISHGGAVIQDWKLLGWADAELTRKTLWIMEKVQVTVSARMNNSLLTYQTDAKNFRIVPQIKGDKLLAFKVTVKTDGTIRQEQGSDIDLSDPKNISKLEKVFSQKIKTEVEEAIEVSQKQFETDYIGFERALKDRRPEIFEKMDWEKEFPAIPIDVEVNAKISKFGLVR